MSPYELELAKRMLDFYQFVYAQGFEGAICWFENAYHITVSKDGKIYSYGEENTLTLALNSCLDGLQKGGF